MKPIAQQLNTYLAFSKCLAYILKDKHFSNLWEQEAIERQLC